MTVALLIISHNRIGQELIATAASILNNTSHEINSISIPANLQPQDLAYYADQIKSTITELHTPQGLLILTDIFGATPDNLAQYFSTGLKVEIVSGINLPMLLRVLNYRGQALDELSATALEGAQKGIIRNSL